MPDISPVLTDITSAREWAELAGMIASGGAPQSLLAVLPETMSVSFLNAYARIVLCHSGSGLDNCPSCQAWVEGKHPDLMIAGDGTGSPGVSDCIRTQSWMNLKPFASEGRLAVIPAAERLSLPAANSLLKLAEEPPEEGRLLFLAEEDNLIPTIRSRVWTVYFSYPGMTEETPPPDDPSQWAEWIDKTRKKSLDELVPEIDAWSRKLCGAGEWDKAASVRNAIYISKKRHLPVSMVQDALAAILREGVTIGQIFSDIR